MKLFQPKEKREFYRAFWEKYLSFPQAAYLGLCLILLTGGGVLLYNLFFAANPNSEIASLNNRDFSDIVSFEDLTTLILTTDNLRSQGGANNLVLEKTTENVFAVSCAARRDNGNDFSADLYSGDSLVFTLNKAFVMQNQYGKEFRLLIPAKMLKKEITMQFS